MAWLQSTWILEPEDEKSDLCLYFLLAVQVKSSNPVFQCLCLDRVLAYMNSCPPGS